jgi:hypothetical protein
VVWCVEMSYLAIIKCVETCGTLAPTRAYQPLADVEVPRTPASFSVSWAFGTVRPVDYSHISVAVHCLLIDWLFVFFHFAKLTFLCPEPSLRLPPIRGYILLPVVLLIACLPAYK